MSKAIFDELVIQCTTELFYARGVEVRPGGDLNGSIEYAATIGFSADNVRGMLGLGMEPSTLQGLVVKCDGAGADVNAEDWLGESVNQLAGRIKNKLTAYNLLISLALPTVLRGVHLRFLPSRPSTLQAYAFESEAGAIFVWLDKQQVPGFILAPSPDPATQAVAEGEVVLF